MIAAFVLLILTIHSDSLDVLIDLVFVRLYLLSESIALPMLDNMDSISSSFLNQFIYFLVFIKLVDHKLERHLALLTVFIVGSLILDHGGKDLPKFI